MASFSVSSAPPVTGALSGDDATKPKKPKSVKETKAKNTVAPKKSRPASSHPPFVVMITDAILALKERSGSSQYAITKYIEENHKQLPGNFRKLLLIQLKRLVASGKLVKVKNSFKLSPASAIVAKPKAKAPVKKSALSEKDKPKKAGTAGGVKRKAAVEKNSPSKKARKNGAAAATTKNKVTPAKNPKKPKSVKSPMKKAKGVKSPVRKPKSVKSPAKKPAKEVGRRGKK
ncbi:PREDICTED: histone H1.1-like [Tarenaya hassleriana]|uniref:histone H1.1-like n=1 Tax=Tarenaya hassleriana TaxID=28532 RepID=UPI00053C87AE|nr:PREDICTED: histone H1.1-like [Tarenaya hassleriana]